MKYRGLIYCAVTLQLWQACWLATCPAFAQEPSSTAPGLLDLDLSSTQRTVSSSEFSGANVNLAAGGSTVTLSGTESLTAAEYLAALQIMSGGRQQLILSAEGHATGGTFSVPTAVAIQNLVVPPGVTAIHDFGTSQMLSVAGNLINSGSIYAVSTNQAIQSGTFTATNIINNHGALLTSVLPPGGLEGYGNSVSSLGLALIAANNLINFGTISSSGSLNLSAASVLNGSTASTAALLSSASNLNLVCANISNYGQITAAIGNVLLQTQNVTNSGLIHAVRGNVQISNLIHDALAISNIQGIIRAGDQLVVENRSGAPVQIEGGTVSANAPVQIINGGTAVVAVQDLIPGVNFESRDISLTITDGSAGFTTPGGLSGADRVELNYSGSGDIWLGNIRTAGGAIELVTDSGRIVVHDITTTAASGDSGHVILSASQSITARDIETTARAASDAGNITLHAGSSISARTIDASGPSGGQIDIRSGAAVSARDITSHGEGASISRRIVERS